MTVSVLLLMVLLLLVLERDELVMVDGSNAVDSSVRRTVQSQCPWQFITSIWNTMRGMVRFVVEVVFGVIASFKVRLLMLLVVLLLLERMSSCRSV